MEKEERIRFYVEIHTPYGVFQGEILEGYISHYNGMLELAKSFYNQEVFETYLSDNSFLVLNRDLIKQSMILVKIFEEE